MALLLLVLQTLMLIAGLSLFAQFIVGIFNWGGRQNNFVYQLFGVLTQARGSSGKADHAALGDRSARAGRCLPARVHRLLRVRPVAPRRMPGQCAAAGCERWAEAGSRDAMSLFFSKLWLRMRLLPPSSSA
jgi:hypothetical protein